MDRFRGAAMVIPQIRCKQDEQTQLALQLLKDAIPEYAKLFAQTLQFACSDKHPFTSKQLKEIQHESARAELGTQFSEALAVAWLYKVNNDNSGAVDSFKKASNRIPQVYVHQVDFEELRKAQQASDDGRLKEAADHYANAFRQLGTP